MPVDYMIDKERGRVVAVVSSPLVLADFDDYFERLRNDPDFDPSFDEFADSRSVGDIEEAPSMLEIRRRAAKSPFGPGSRRAVVISDDLQFGLTRAYGIFQEDMGAEMAVFRDPADAERWLEEG